MINSLIVIVIIKTYIFDYSITPVYTVFNIKLTILQNRHKADSTVKLQKFICVRQAYLPPA